MERLVTRDPEVNWNGGFCRHAVPVQTLLDYIEGNLPLDEFLDDFPTVARDRAAAFLESAKAALLDHVA